MMCAAHLPTADRPAACPSERITRSHVACCRELTFMTSIQVPLPPEGKEAPHMVSRAADVKTFFYLPHPGQQCTTSCTKTSHSVQKSF